MEQQYDKYTAEDFEVWRVLFERQVAQLPGMATDEYLAGIQRIGFTADRIPNFTEVNRVLADYTGWQLHVVAGLIPNKEFWKSRICSTTCSGMCRCSPTSTCATS